MLSNVRVFLRILQRQKLFSVINLLGITVSMTSAVLIYLYVSHELSYDSFHQHTDRLYRVNQTFIWAQNEESQFSRTGPGVAHALKEELPEVELITSIHTPGNFIVSYVEPDGDVISFEEDKVLAADTNFFKVLNFPLVAGNEVTALREANQLVMTRSAAKKYFGTTDPIGKMVTLGGLRGSEAKTFEVTGVIEDVPENSTIHFDILLSTRSFPAIENRYWSWVWTQLETFVLLRPDADIEAVREKLKDIPRKRADESIRAAMGVSYDEYIKSGKNWDLFLQPITKLHIPETPVAGSFSDIASVKVIYSFVGAAVFVVLLSCINFMNLSTAQFTKRIREAGIRKILGMDKNRLRLTFFFEALAFCLIALIISLALIQMLLPAFNAVAGKHLKLSLWQQPTLIIVMLLLALFMALVSSIYPAISLASFNPVNALRGKSKAGNTGRAFRNGLVVFQFSVSIVLIICTSIVFQQLRYVSEKDLGFDKENLIVLHHAEAVAHIETLTNALISSAGVLNASWCSSVPPDLYGGDSFSVEGIGDKKLALNFAMIDANYIPTLNIRLKFGRNFRPDSPSDSNRVILNESAVRSIGWSVDESTLGKFVTYPNSGSGFARFEVIGIVSDFNYWSIENAIEPMAMFNMGNKYIRDSDRDYIVIKARRSDMEAWNKLLLSIESTWKTHAKNTVFQYSFVDENFEETFATQRQFGKILTVMATLAIVIAALGLLGMVVFSLEQRTKEIGIRKVSGASVANILSLITRGYMRLILIAFIFSAPVAWYCMQLWLKDFVYRIAPSPWTFIGAGTATVVIALCITLYHSLKAALTNPVDVLRDE
ncbi:ABC transporter permease [Chryseolinea sp. T2]|uniref:ABC transporter permease n=1 Tax=Chryseolinea sp. T2 TaxID=3129255 RepID=UPI00307802EC